MNCDKVKQNIYGYDELTETEKGSLHDHIAQCNSCALLFREMQQQRALFRKASQWKDLPPNPDRLTQNVMSSIKTPAGRKVRPVGEMIDRINLVPLRLALTSLSFFLIIFFVSEYNMTQSTSRYNKSYSETLLSEKKEALDSGRLVERLKQKKRPTPFTSFYDCIKRCGLADWQYLCEECKIKFQKLVKKYENS
ncbi:hypothetical protein QQ020_22540 [Fulvivirgaceae bacterium BMA12]|uniref:Zinc-finger domain-containing protein n=1 Tax=Agaribacillus aureus TaxID=3051825 RepID=A0ABT8LCE5_9BACT|nr:hypothetical protein [Fulvivirgaceae bacterium BMA12]